MLIKYNRIYWLSICWFLFFQVLSLLMLYGIANGQSKERQNKVMGEVVSVDIANRQIALKMEKDSLITVQISENTTLGRVPPGVTSMAQAVTTSLTEIGGGDRMLVIGEFSENRQSIKANQVFIISRVELAKKLDSDKQQWRQRGISGSIVSINAEGKTLEAQVRTQEGVKTIKLLLNQSSSLRRYSIESVAYNDAVTSSIDQIKPGDLFRALGNRSDDNTSYTVEEVLYGTFRTTPGTIVSVDVKAGEAKFHELDKQQPITAIIGKQMYTRRLSNQLAIDLTDSLKKKNSQNQPEINNVDFQQKIDGMPPVNINELKAGDKLFLIGLVGENQTRLLAIAIIAGVDPLVKLIEDQHKANKAKPNYKLGLPESLTGLSIALP